MPLVHIRERLTTYEPEHVDDPLATHAAVALILHHEPEQGPRVLLIRRAKREEDPWSRHMALPGGRQDPRDPHLIGTAIRETREEVGLELSTGAEFLGALDELRALAHARPIDLIISPFVFAVARACPLRTDPREVDEAVWIPLSALRKPAAHTSYRRVLHDIEQDYPAYRYGDRVIWGLTYRILDRFLELTADTPAPTS